MNTYVLLLLSYLMGSIPSALIIGKIFTGTDVREHGSGNMGTTNVFRVLGKKYGIVVFLMDYTKGAVIVGLIHYNVITLDVYIHVLWFAAAAVIGHAFPIFAKFKGGKAVATSGGIITVLTPLVFALAISAFIITVYLSGYVSLGTLAAAAVGIATSIAILYDKPDMHPILIFYIVLLAFVIYKHKSNIKRLLNGTESGFKNKKK